METLKQVGDIPDYFSFISQDSEVIEINKEYETEFDSFFIEYFDGDILSLYGMYGIVPYKDKLVYRVK
jgi:hypothetical protein